jgi:FixJ family two-component response regulator
MISIVDDDESVRTALERLMKAHGFLVRTFESAASLLISEHRDLIDLLIADVQMPGMTGLELHDRLLADGFSIPTVLITGHPDETVRSRALRAGVLCYLTKPFDEAELLNCIRSAVGQREANGRPA